MIRQTGMGSILDPNPSLLVHVTSFSLLRSHSNCLLYDHLVPASVRRELGDERVHSGSRQFRLSDLRVDLLGKAGGHRGSAWREFNSCAARPFWRITTATSSVEANGVLVCLSL